jgi:hypothetical protein
LIRVPFEKEPGPNGGSRECPKNGDHKKLEIYKPVNKRRAPEKLEIAENCEKAASAREVEI